MVLLEGVANASIPLEPFLRQWDEEPSVSAQRHLARFVNGELEELVNGWRRRGEVRWHDSLRIGV